MVHAHRQGLSTAERETKRVRLWYDFFTDGSQAVLKLIALNLGPAVVGSGVAVRRFLGQGTGGAIVNISSHQASRAVLGALPYATAKAAVEGLTRALAVDYGPYNVRVNTVALDSITTECYERFLEQQKPSLAAQTEQEMRRLHPLGRVGRAEEVAATVAYLLSDEASFISGVTLPVERFFSRAVLRVERASHGGP